MKEVTMITGNMGKWRIASDIFKKYNVKLNHIKMETPEIQSHYVEDVSRYSAEYAANKLNIPVIKSDVGYYIEDLGGFPGPFLRYANEMLTSWDIIKMMEGKVNRKILLKECLTYAEPGKETKQFINIEEATIADKPEGNGTTFDQIVIFKGDDHPKSLNTEEENYQHFEKTLIIYDKMAKFLEGEDNEKNKK